jgi:hypothetical protein
MWYPSCSNQNANAGILHSGTTITVKPTDYSRMPEPTNNKVYSKYFYDTLLDLVIRIGFFRVGMLNLSANRYEPLEGTIAGIVRHEWRHVLQSLYLLKHDFYTHKTSKRVDIVKLYSYNSPENIFEEDAREVQYTNPNKPIEEFYKQYKRYEYVYLKRNQQHRGISEPDLILTD